MPDWMDDMNRQSEIMQEKQAERDRIQREADARHHAFLEQIRAHEEQQRRDRERERAWRAEREADARRKAQAAASSRTNDNSWGKAAAVTGATAAAAAAPAQASTTTSGASGAPSGGSLSTVLTWAAIIGVGAIIIGGNNDKDAPQKAPNETVQPLKPGQILENAKELSKVPAKNRLFITTQDTEISVPFMRNRSIYEYSFMVEKGSCFSQYEKSGFTNALQGTLAANSPVKTPDNMVIGLANPTHVIVDQIGTKTAPKPCEVTLKAIGNAGIPAPTEPGIEAMAKFAMQSANYYVTTEAVDVHASRSSTSDIEYRLQEGSCLRVLSTGPGPVYIGAYKDLASMIVYDGYVDPSKLQQKVFPEGSSEFCTAKLASAAAPNSGTPEEGTTSFPVATENPAPPSATTTNSTRGWGVSSDAFYIVKAPAIDLMQGPHPEQKVLGTVFQDSCLVGFVEEEQKKQRANGYMRLLGYDAQNRLTTSGYVLEKDITRAPASMTEKDCIVRTSAPQPAPAQDVQKTAAPPQDQAGAPKPEPVATYAYFKATQDVVVSSPHVRDGIIEEFNQTVKAGSCLRVQTFIFKNLTDTALEDVASVKGFFDLRKVETLDAGSPLAHDCRATLAEGSPSGGPFQNSEPLEYILDSDEQTVYIALEKVHVYDSGAESASVRYSFDRGACFHKNTNATGTYSSFVTGVGGDATVYNGFVDLTELTPVPAEKIPDCIATPAP